MIENLTAFTVSLLDSNSSGYGMNVSVGFLDSNSSGYGMNITPTRRGFVPPRLSCQLHQRVWLMRVIIDVWLSMPVEILGILGNILAIIVLYKQRPSTTTSVLLQCLAVTDIVILLYNMAFRTLRTFDFCYVAMPGYRQAVARMFYYVFPLTYIVRFCSIWLTVLLTIDRFIAVCRPLHAQRLCTLSRVWKEVAILLVVSIIYNIPRFLENEHMSNHHRVKGKDILGNNIYYLIVYRCILNSLFMYIIPVFLLAILNMILLCNLHVAEVSRNSIRAPSKEVSGRRDITVIVVIVVTVFIACNIPTAISHFLTTIQLVTKSRINFQTQVANNISNLLVTVNSAINFLIYCLCSRNFRKTTRKVFCRRLFSVKRRLSSQGSNMTTFFSWVKYRIGTGNVDAAENLRLQDHSLQSGNVRESSDVSEPCPHFPLTPIPANIVLHS